MAAEHRDSRSADLRVLVLSKRQYMARDLLDDRYGRFRELPLVLANSGAHVAGICLSYRSRPEIVLDDGAQSTPVRWTSLNLPRLLPLGSKTYWHALDRIAADLRPNVIFACSDVPHAVLGAAAARRLGAKLVIDLYDNFESYPLARVPGVNLALRRAVNAADGVSCVSPPLARLVREKYGFRGEIELIENAIPPGAFEPADRRECRRQFELPDDAVLIGTAGALSRSRGTDCLFQAFDILAKERSDLHLVLAGAPDPRLPLPTGSKVHYLGLLPASQVPHMLSVLDVSVVCNRDSPFGRYCFPQKLYESIACGVPVAVARVGAMAELLRDFPANLYEPENVDSLVATLRGLCQRPTVPALEIATWQSLGERLGHFLQRIAPSARVQHD